MALKSVTSLVLTGSAALVLSYLFAHWRSRSKHALTAAARIAEAPSVPPRLAPRPIVHFGESVSQKNSMLQDVDGGVSARPTERMHESINHYDAEGFDELGAEYLARAVQVPREGDDELNDWDANGIHIDQLSETGSEDGLTEEEPWSEYPEVTVGEVIDAEGASVAIGRQMPVEEGLPTEDPR